MSKKFCVLACVVLCVALSVAGAAFGADKAELKKMSIFISNFTEVRLFNFDLEDDDDDGEEPLHFGSNNAALLAFGVNHNAINNKKLIKKGSFKVNGSTYDRAVDAKTVAASVRRYFDLPVEHEDGVDKYGQVYPYRKGMYYFHAASGEEVIYADVQKVSKKGGVITMSGELYNVESRRDTRGTFVATAKPHKWNGKATWAILSMSSELD